MAHGRSDEASNILHALLPDVNIAPHTSPIVAADMAEIQLALDEERKASSGNGFMTIFKNGEQKFFYRTMLGIGGQFMQQLSGINLITYYAPVIFEQSVGMPHSLALLLAGFNGVAYFLSSLIPIWLIDRLGRRKLMIFAAAGQCVCMAILAGTVSNGGSGAGIVATVMLFLFNFFFAVGLLAIPWLRKLLVCWQHVPLSHDVLVPAEYAPLAIRTRAASLATASNWIFTFLVVEITPVSIKNIGWRTYVYFAGMCALSCLFANGTDLPRVVFNAAFLPLIYFLYPETQNLTLEQIDKLFTGEKVKLHWSPSMGEIGRVAQPASVSEIVVDGGERKVDTSTQWVD